MWKKKKKKLICEKHEKLFFAMQGQRRHLETIIDSIAIPWITLFFVGVIMLSLVTFLPYRAEKERSQYFGEVNDLRHSLDQVANEKV